MGDIVLGVGTSHSPLLTLETALWGERGNEDIRNDALTLSDGRSLAYPALLAERGAVYAEQAGQAILAAQAGHAQSCLDRLADAIEAAAPDVVLIIGDDQEELYRASNTPSIAIYYGDEVVMRPLGEIVPDPPTWMRAALGGYAMDTAHHFPAAAAFCSDLIARLMDKNVDLAVTSKVEDAKAAAFGHAYGFIVQRLFRGKKIPVAPLLLNTYYPPNVIKPARCYEIGERIREAIEDMPGGTRVAIVASGGLSHFVTDAELDRNVLQALRTDDAGFLRALPMPALRAGSSEILCWVMAGGVLRGLDCGWSDYIPVYRTPAGTGIGLGFALWTPRPGGAS